MRSRSILGILAVIIVSACSNPFAGQNDNELSSSSAINTAISDNTSSAKSANTVLPKRDFREEDVMRAAQFWRTRANTGELIHIAWLDEPLQADAIEVLEKAGKLGLFVQSVTHAIQRKELELETSSGSITYEGIRHWSQGASKVEPLAKPIEQYVLAEFKNDLEWYKLGTVTDGQFKDSELYWMEAGCYVNEYGCDTFNHRILVTPDGRILRIDRYSGPDGYISVLPLEAIDVRNMDMELPPVIHVPGSAVPLVRVAISNGGTPFPFTDKEGKVAFTDAISGLAVYETNHSCCTVKSRDGSIGLYQFDFDQLSLYSQSQPIILHAPALQAGIVSFIHTDGTPNQQSYEHNTYGGCNILLQYEHREKVTDDVEKKYIQIGTIAGNVPVYRDPNPPVNGWLESLYTSRIKNSFSEETKKMTFDDFYADIPVIYIKDPLGGLAGFISTAFPNPAECGGRDLYRDISW